MRHEFWCLEAQSRAKITVFWFMNGYRTTASKQVDSMSNERYKQSCNDYLDREIAQLVAQQAHRDAIKEAIFFRAGVGA